MPSASCASVNRAGGQVGVDHRSGAAEAAQVHDGGRHVVEQRPVVGRAPVDDTAAPVRVRAERLGSGIGVQHAARPAVRSASRPPVRDGRADGRPDPWPEVQAGSGRVHPVEALGAFDGLPAQTEMNAGQGRADQPLLALVLSGERDAGHPGKQGCAPAAGGVDGELAYGRAQRLSRRHACALDHPGDLQPLRERVGEVRSHCFEYPALADVRRSTSAIPCRLVPLHQDVVGKTQLSPITRRASSSVIMTRALSR